MIPLLLLLTIIIITIILNNNSSSNNNNNNNNNKLQHLHHQHNQHMIYYLMSHKQITSHNILLLQFTQPHHNNIHVHMLMNIHQKMMNMMMNMGNIHVVIINTLITLNNNHIMNVAHQLSPYYAERYPPQGQQLPPPQQRGPTRPHYDYAQPYYGRQPEPPQYDYQHYHRPEADYSQAPQRGGQNDRYYSNPGYDNNPRYGVQGSNNQRNQNNQQRNQYNRNTPSGAAPYPHG
eukprot:UN03266